MKEDPETAKDKKYPGAYCSACDFLVQRKQGSPGPKYEENDMTRFKLCLLLMIFFRIIFNNNA